MTRGLAMALPVRPDDLESDAILADLRAGLEAMPCTPETYPGICDALIQVKARVKDLEAQEARIADPIKQAAKAVKAWFAAPLTTYRMIETTLKARVGAYQDTLRQEKQAAIVAASQAPTPAAMATLTALAVPPTPAAVSFRMVWEVEITDPNLVPREFLLIDMVALRKVAQATSGSHTIPGVRFVTRRAVAVGS